MTEQEKREEKKIRLKRQLGRKVREHRPAEKVLELEIMMGEDQLERLEEHKRKMESMLEYLRTLKPSDIEEGMG
ncbi:MAG: hypothetical protein U9N01_04605 [Euryarchaeota archaeon]|nr:hypothetical protein [Euryarchaeota archaeon]